jgi:hypothetical protein
VLEPAIVSVLGLTNPVGSEACVMTVVAAENAIIASIIADVSILLDLFIFHLSPFSFERLFVRGIDLTWTNILIADVVYVGQFSL